jgi:hypothetical protein
MFIEGEGSFPGSYYMDLVNGAIVIHLYFQNISELVNFGLGGVLQVWKYPDEVEKRRLF